MAEKSTSMTFLYYKATPGATTFTVLVPITSYPDIFTPPEKLDISDLSSNQKKYIPGMIDLPDYEFGFVYNKTDYAKVKALEGKTSSFQLRFGSNGEYGAWQWDGDIFVTPNGGSVGAVREAKLICYPSGDVTEATVTP